MRISLLPEMIYPALTSLDLQALERRGLRLLMLDFDNTIVPYTTNEPTPEMERWLREALSSQVQLCVVSNSKKPRVVQFCKKQGIPCITHARKPFSTGISRCLQQFGVPPEAAALCGDQIYTDVLGANCAGVHSILVSSIHNHNMWLKLRHVLELPVLFFAKGRKVL